MSYLEKIVGKFLEDAELKGLLRGSFNSDLKHRTLERYGLDVPDSLLNKLDDTRRQRKLAAHGRKEPTKPEVDEAINTVEQFERFLASVDPVEFAKDARDHIEERHVERQRYKTLKENAKKIASTFKDESG